MVNAGDDYGTLGIPLRISDLSKGVERLWSLAGATGGNRFQMEHPQKPLKQADRQSVATHGNRFGAHGKEGVDRLRTAAQRIVLSSPSLVASYDDNRA